MKLPSVHCMLFVVVASISLANPAAGQRKLTQRDKSQIIQSILRGYDFTQSETWRDNRDNTIYLLGENVSATDFPLRRGVKFTIIDQNEVDRLRETGVEYYQFSRIVTAKANVRVSLTRTYRSPREGNGSVVEYTCRKVNGRWKLKARVDGVYAT